MSTIFYISTKAHGYTIRSYLESWGTSFKERILSLTYEDFLEHKSFAPGHYIFSDLERLTIRELDKSRNIWNTLDQSNGKIQILNHPTRSMRRYELLRNLFEKGINCFDVYRLTEGRKPKNFPVFIRVENAHHGAATKLFETQTELDGAIEELLRVGAVRDVGLIVEFVDTKGDDGLYRKYSAFAVGDDVMPVHIQFSKNSIVKHTDIVTEETVREELAYHDNFPHEDVIRNIFKMARIDYGRIDYSLKNGNVVVWEINTNPMLYLPASSVSLRRPAQKKFFDRFEISLRNILDMDVKRSSGSG